MSWMMNEEATAIARDTIQTLCEGEDLTAWLQRMARTWWQLGATDRHRVRLVLRGVTRRFGAEDPCATLDHISDVLQDLADVLREASRGPTEGDDTRPRGNA